MLAKRGPLVCMRERISFQPQHEQHVIKSLLRRLMNGFKMTAGDRGLYWDVLQSIVTSIFYTIILIIY